MISSLWDTIATEAAAESLLWEHALLPRSKREEVTVFSALGLDRYALATESIYEGYLLHYGRPRLFHAPDADTAVLLGDYLYAHGLVRLAAHGDAGAVADLAELISLCTQLRAATPCSGDADGAAWAATAALLGSVDGELERAREALRLSGDPGPLERAATGSAGGDAVRRALAAHRTRVE